MYYHNFTNPNPIYYFCEIEYIHKTEVFKPIVGFETLYHVSDLGRVKSINYNHTKKERLLKLSLNSDGYFKVSLFKNKKNKVIKVHQVVAIMFLGHKPCGYKLVINHKNIDRLDNRKINLEIVTQRENSNRKHLKSTSKYVGVYWHSRDKKWNASIAIGRKSKHLGAYDNESKAKEAYDNELIKINNNNH